jgi:hypothetical protein
MARHCKPRAVCPVERRRPFFFFCPLHSGSRATSALIGLCLAKLHRKAVVDWIWRSAKGKRKVVATAECVLLLGVCIPHGVTPWLAIVNLALSVQFSSRATSALIGLCLAKLHRKAVVDWIWRSAKGKRVPTASGGFQFSGGRCYGGMRSPAGCLHSSWGHPKRAVVERRVL